MKEEIYEACEKRSEYLANNPGIVHNSVNLNIKYVEKGGEALSRRQLVSSINADLEIDGEKNITLMLTEMFVYIFKAIL